jgi:hypothetical protein
MDSSSIKIIYAFESKKMYPPKCEKMIMISEMDTYLKYPNYDIFLTDKMLVFDKDNVGYRSIDINSSRNIYKMLNESQLNVQFTRELIKCGSTTAMKDNISGSSLFVGPNDFGRIFDKNACEIDKIGIKHNYALVHYLLENKTPQLSFDEIDECCVLLQISNNIGLSVFVNNSITTFDFHMGDKIEVMKLEVSIDALVNSVKSFYEYEQILADIKNGKMKSIHKRISDVLLEKPYVLKSNNTEYHSIMLDKNGILTITNSDKYWPIKDTTKSIDLGKNIITYIIRILIPSIIHKIYN